MITVVFAYLWHDYRATVRDAGQLTRYVLSERKANREPLVLLPQDEPAFPSWVMEELKSIKPPLEFHEVPSIHSEGIPW
jgi:hypothetical protein